MFSLFGTKSGSFKLQDGGEEVVVGRTDFEFVNLKISRQQLSFRVVNSELFVRVLGLNNSAVLQKNETTILKKGMDEFFLEDEAVIFTSAENRAECLLTVRQEAVEVRKGRKPAKKKVKLNREGLRDFMIDEDFKHDGRLTRVWDEDGETYTGVVVEPARSGRAQCRKCYKKIEKNVLRTIMYVIISLCMFRF
jgi:hypothetical protein